MTKRPPPIPFDDAVAEARELQAKVEGIQWRLGELAARLEPTYGGKTLARFAEAIDVPFETLKMYRFVFRAYGGKVPRGTFSAAKELAKHPDRAKILEENPNMTSRDAERLVKEYAFGLQSLDYDEGDDEDEELDEEQEAAPQGKPISFFRDKGEQPVSVEPTESEPTLEEMTEEVADLFDTLFLESDSPINMVAARVDELDEIQRKTLRTVIASARKHLDEIAAKIDASESTGKIESGANQKETKAGQRAPANLPKPAADASAAASPA